MSEGPQMHRDGAGLLQEEDVRRVARAVAERLGVLAEFDDIVSGRRVVRALLDDVDLAQAECEARALVIGIEGRAQDTEDASRAGRTCEAHEVFSQEAMRFTAKRGTEDADEYAFDTGKLEFYEHHGAADGYAFCYEDGHTI